MFAWVRTEKITGVRAGVGLYEI
ncbi:MAG: hypothetical protein JWR49_3177, partial [Tardiphaga sp.]|nr:hypothetical protein [Tardiphaga sp.]